MITLAVDKDSGRIKLDHYGTAPLVYLDHAPLMELAEHHADRFVEALLERNGTLAFSWLHLVELGKVRSDETANAVEALLLRLWPKNVAFLQVRAEKVIENENSLMSGGPRRAPHLDDELLDAYFKQKKSGSVNPIDGRGFVHSLRSPKVAADIAALRTEVSGEAFDAITRNAELYKADPSIRARFKVLKGPPIQQPTRYIYIEAGRYVIRTGARLATQNDVDDFHHAVVALSYCDFVVLDKNWKDAARQIQGRVRAAGLLTHEARVYKVGELTKFLADLRDAGIAANGGTDPSGGTALGRPPSNTD